MFLTTGIGPQVYRKEEIYHHDRTTGRYISHRPISTKLKDLDRGQKDAGRAKYVYFSGFTRQKSQWAFFANTPNKALLNEVVVDKQKRMTFNGFTRGGLVLLYAVFSFTVPLFSAQARDFSYLFENKLRNVAVSAVRSEPQSSQTISFLEGAVNFDPNPAKGGGDITVVDDSALLSEVGPSGTIADVEENEHKGRVVLYVVRPGDTVSQVAKMFGVNTSTILWANDIPKGAELRSGQHLVILPIDGIQYTVKKGDTLQAIAIRFKGDINDILEFNEMKSAQRLSVGDVIVIPDGKEDSSPSSAPSNNGGRSRVIASYPSYSGYYSHPVPEGHKSQGVHGYNGVDYGAPVGTPVYSSAEGTVIVSKFTTKYCGRYCGGGYGNYIVIEHPNGTQTLYAHLSAVYTQSGVRVDKGQWIGEVGNTGKSTGSHLHFEVRGAKNPF